MKLLRTPDKHFDNLADYRVVVPVIQKLVPGWEHLCQLRLNLNIAVQGLVHRAAIDNL